MLVSTNLFLGKHISPSSRPSSMTCILDLNIVAGAKSSQEIVDEKTWLLVMRIEREGIWRE